MVYLGGIPHARQPMRCPQAQAETEPGKIATRTSTTESNSTTETGIGHTDFSTESNPTTGAHPQKRFGEALAHVHSVLHTRFQNFGQKQTPPPRLGNTPR